MNVTGAWKGEYAFEETEEGGGKAVAGTVVTFTMQLKQGWLGAVTGTVKDDPRIGFPEEGTIKGRLKGTVFAFDKLQPVVRLIQETNRLSLEQWTERHKIVMSLNETHPKIGHIGDLSEDGNAIDGTWLMKELRLPVPGSGSVFYIPKLVGTFKMTRQQQ